MLLDSPANLKVPNLCEESAAFKLKENYRQVVCSINGYIILTKVIKVIWNIRLRKRSATSSNVCLSVEVLRTEFF